MIHPMSTPESGRKPSEMVYVSDLIFRGVRVLSDEAAEAHIARVKRARARMFAKKVQAGIDAALGAGQAKGEG